MFVGTQNGAAALRGDQVTTLADLPHPNVHGFAQYRGQLWVATEGGLAVCRRSPDADAGDASGRGTLPARTDRQQN